MCIRDRVKNPRPLTRGFGAEFGSRLGEGKVGSDPSKAFGAERVAFGWEDSVWLLGLRSGPCHPKAQERPRTLTGVLVVSVLLLFCSMKSTCFFGSFQVKTCHVCKCIEELCIYPRHLNRLRVRHMTHVCARQHELQASCLRYTSRCAGRQERGECVENTRRTLGLSLIHI